MIALVPNLQIGNPEAEALASLDWKLELPIKKWGLLLFLI
jgi:hypothetical protein